MTEGERVVERFGYREQIERVYPRLGDFMSAMRSWVSEHKTLDDEQLFRFLLCTLWFDYRAANHSSSGFHTRVEEWTHLDRRPEVREKLELINQHLGRPIGSVKEYLSLMGIKEPLKVDGQFLFRFVIDGPRSGGSAGGE